MSPLRSLVIIISSRNCCAISESLELIETVFWFCLNKLLFNFFWFIILPLFLLFRFCRRGLLSRFDVFFCTLRICIRRWFFSWLLFFFSRILQLACWIFRGFRCQSDSFAFWFELATIAKAGEQKNALFALLFRLNVSCAFCSKDNTFVFLSVTSCYCGQNSASFGSPRRLTSARLAPTGARVFAVQFGNDCFKKVCFWRKLDAVSDTEFATAS